MIKISSVTEEWQKCVQQKCMCVCVYLCVYVCVCVCLAGRP